MRGICSLGRAENPKLGGATAAVWLLLPLVVLCVLKADFLPPSARRIASHFPVIPRSEVNESVASKDSSKLATSSNGDAAVSNLTAGPGETSRTTFADEKVENVSSLGTVRELEVEKDHNSTNPGPDDQALLPQASNMTNHSVVNSETLHTEGNSAAVVALSADPKEKNGENNTSLANSEEEKQHLAMKGSTESSVINSESTAPRSNLTCDFEQFHTDTCVMAGDIRVQGNASTVFVVSPSHYRPDNATQKLRPYARKWEQPTMATVRELTILSAPGPGEAPPCAAAHDVPAVVFSLAGFSNNFFHTFTDILIPLYTTSGRYRRRVQLLAADFSEAWVAKYRPLLAGLSEFPVIDLDADPLVRCFPAAHVGLESSKVLSIDPAKTRSGLTMGGFRAFLRSALELERPFAPRVSIQAGRKPRLLLMLRRGSRSITNEEAVIATAASVGFEVVPARPEDARGLRRFARVVNSCDVLVGVHGAGLTNMVFLPDNATVVQIIPWGELKWPCWSDFGEPAPDMGLRYAEYEIGAEESSLREKYPRDHAVFTDPLSIHRMGFVTMWKTFLDEQNVRLDVERFRLLLLEVWRSIVTE